MSERPTPVKVTRRTILAVPPAAQTESPLYVMPPEIRDLIFRFALTDYPDPNPRRQYSTETLFTRPEYYAPRRTDTALLRTCRAIYSECWFMPFTLKEHTHWLAAQDRAPPEYQKVIYAGGASNFFRGWSLFWEDQGEECPEIRHLRLFAQMWALEQQKLAALMAVPGLRPRRLILTIRHTDWWFWENDEPLHIMGGWIEDLSEALPSSIQEFCIELETIRRKKEQLKAIVKKMGEKWFFKREDGVVLFPDATGKNIKASEWAGSSRWGRKRWVRDETSPGRIDYDVMHVPFRPAHVVLRAGGKVSEDARLAADGDIYDREELDLIPDVFDVINGRGYIPLNVYGDEVGAAVPGAVRNTGHNTATDSDEDEIEVDYGQDLFYLV